MKEFFFKSYIHHLIFFIPALVFSIKADKSLPDDGLRHIAFSYNKDIMNSWGEVFPHSLFNSYDPWFMWHNLLRFLSKIVDYEYIHIVINTFSLYILMILIAFHIKNEFKYNFSSLIYIIVYSLAYMVSFRYLMVRPDLLSGLYILCALLLGSRGFFPLFFITLIYAPFYYLFFIYTGSIGLVYLIQKKIRAFMGVFFASVISLSFFLINNFEGYINTIRNILNDQKLRMGLDVGEGKPIFDFLSNINYFLLIGIFLVVCALLIYKKYNYFKSNTIGLFLLITSVLWINQARYFALFLPLIIVYVFAFISNFNKRRLFFLVRKYSIFLLKYVNYSKKVFIFYIIAIPYTIYIISLKFESDFSSQNKDIVEANFFKDEVFDNKVILLNIMNSDIYKALYHNPTIHFIPSCSIGWFSNENKYMKDIYVRMQKEDGINEEELRKFIKYIQADFYIHYLKNPKQVLDFDKLEKYGILPQKIYHDRIIFKINKEIINE